jgi:hypothetical protein
VDSAVLVLFSANRAAFRCVAFGLEANSDTVLFSKFMDALTDLLERPEVMQLLVAHFAVVRVVSDMLQVAYNKICDSMRFQVVVEVS